MLTRRLLPLQIGIATDLVGSYREVVHDEIGFRGGLSRRDGRGYASVVPLLEVPWQA
jgi:hypothetical protein